MSLFAHKKRHRQMAVNALERIQAKRRNGESDEADDAAQAVAGALLALADEVGELRDSLAPAHTEEKGEGRG